jgi:hypothetical protein
VDHVIWLCYSNAPQIDSHRLLPRTARVWEHFTSGGPWWRPHASVLPTTCASSFRSCTRFWNIAWRCRAAHEPDHRYSEAGKLTSPSTFHSIRLINSIFLHVAWLSASEPYLASLAGLAVLVRLLKYLWLCVKTCPVDVHVTWLYLR